MRLIEQWLIDDNFDTLGLDPFHNALHGRRSEII